VRRFIVFALAGGLALAACGGSDGAKGLRTERAVAEAATTAPSAATAHTPGSLRHLEGARTDVHDTSCAAGNGAWRAAGRVTNTTKVAVRYRIYVSFLHGHETVGISEADPDPVAPAATERWRATLPVETPGLRCILRVERATA